MIAVQDMIAAVRKVLRGGQRVYTGGRHVVADAATMAAAGMRRGRDGQWQGAPCVMHGARVIISNHNAMSSHARRVNKRIKCQIFSQNKCVRTCLHPMGEHSASRCQINFK